MVPTPAPKSRFLKTDATPATPEWTKRFVRKTASRPGQLSRPTTLLGLLLISSIGVLPMGAQTENGKTENGKTENGTIEAELAPNLPVSEKLKSETDEMPLAISPLVSPSPSSKQFPQVPQALAASSQSPSLLTPQKPASSAPAAISPGASSREKSPGKPASSLVLSPQPRTISLRVVVSGKTQIASVAVKPQMTVGSALAAMGISLGALDRVMPEASALAQSNATIHVTRVGAELKTRRVPIRAEVRYSPSTKLAAGRQQTTQTPRDGYFLVTERIWKRDGQVTKREFVSQKMGLAPRHQIVSLGTKSHIMPQAIRPHKRYARANRNATLLASRGGSPLDRALMQQVPTPENTFRVVKTLTGVLATGYSAGPAGGAIGNWTATGVRCTYGAVAVDPRVIPLGSKLYIEGYGYGFACDTGGAIKGKKIDLAFNSPQAAFRHGRQRVTVHILAP